ncbi:hypothetical protein EDD22DRAFT_853818, partial [Suillus occidentalis]
MAFHRRPCSNAHAFFAASKQNAELPRWNPIAISRVKPAQQFGLLSAAPLEFNSKFEPLGGYWKVPTDGSWKYWPIFTVLFSFRQEYTAASTYASPPPPSAHRQHGYLKIVSIANTHRISALPTPFNHGLRGAVIMQEGETAGHSLHNHFGQPSKASLLSGGAVMVEEGDDGGSIGCVCGSKPTARARPVGISAYDGDSVIVLAVASAQ